MARVIGPVDRAIKLGQLPPMIVASPDGRLLGRPTLFLPGCFYLNTRAGNFEDFLMADVWDFVTSRYPVRPERGAHVIAGVSMGGGAAFNKAIKYPDLFRVAVGVFPPLNTRWEDCHGRYMANFDPCCWGWRTNFNRPCSAVGRAGRSARSGAGSSASSRAPESSFPSSAIVASASHTGFPCGRSGRWSPSRTARTPAGGRPRRSGTRGSRRTASSPRSALGGPVGPESVAGGMFRPSPSYPPGLGRRANSAP